MAAPSCSIDGFKLGWSSDLYANVVLGDLCQLHRDMYTIKFAPNRKMWPTGGNMIQSQVHHTKCGFESGVLPWDQLDETNEMVSGLFGNLDVWSWQLIEPWVFHKNRGFPSPCSKFFTYKSPFAQGSTSWPKNKINHSVEENSLSSGFYTFIINEMCNINNEQL